MTHMDKSDFKDMQSVRTNRGIIRLNAILFGLLDCGHNSDAWRNSMQFLHDFDNWISVAETTEIPFVAWRLLNHAPKETRADAGWYYYAPQAGYSESRPYWHGPVEFEGLSRRTDPGYERQFYVSPEVAAGFSAALMRLKIIVYKSGAATKDGRFHFGGTHGHTPGLTERPYFSSGDEMQAAEEKLKGREAVSRCL